MAACEKYTNGNVIYEMRHNTRETPKPPSNEDIDKARTSGNFSLAPEDRGSAQPDGGAAAAAARAYHKARLSEVYTYGRDDLVTACQWVITAPQDLAPEQEADFWRETYAFLNSLYGEKNCVQAIVHTDEGLKVHDKVISGRAHLHYMFIPVVDNPKYQQPNRYGNITGSALYEEKVSADALITRQHLREFHPRYQAWLDEHGIHATVHTGETGGNSRTVDDLKRDTLRTELVKANEKLAAITEDYISLQREAAERSHELAEARAEASTLREENHALQERVAALEREKTKEITSGWGSSSGWGKEIGKEWTY